MNCSAPTAFGAIFRLNGVVMQSSKPPKLTDRTFDPNVSDIPSLAADVFAQLACDDFASCRSAAARLSALHFDVSRVMVHRYDPKDAEGFADLITFFAQLFPDQREAASVLGVSVSTWYRWKAGDAVPHALVRSTIRDTIIRFLAERDLSNSGSSRENGGAGDGERARTH